MAKKESVLIGIVVLFLVYLALPTLGSMVGGPLDEATSVLLTVAPKVAVVAGLAALIMLCIPFTRQHARGMLLGAILLAVGAAAFPVVVTWLGVVTRYAAHRLRLVLIDLKGGMEFNAFRDLPHLLYPVVSEIEDCEIALGLVGQEMDRRQRMFASAGAENLGEWNATHAGAELPWLVAVVDEFGELRAADAPRQSPERGRRDAVHAQISRAGRIGRAVGVHLVVCTQRPDADTVTPQLRAQLPATLALHCVTDTNSRVLLDNSAAADLAPRPGRAIWQWDRQVEVQLPMLEKAAARSLLAAAAGRDVGVEDEADAA